MSLYFQIALTEASVSHAWLRRCKNTLQINSFAFIFYLSALVAKLISNILKACGQFILVDTMPPSGYIIKKTKEDFTLKMLHKHCLGKEMGGREGGNCGINVYSHHLF